MAEELQLTIQVELCKATVESARSVAKHLKIEESEVKDKSKISIVNKIGQVIEERLISISEEEKVSFLQAIVQILVDIPPPLKNVDKDKDQSELLSLRKETEALKLTHEQKMKETVGMVESKVRQETDGMSPLHSLIESTSVLRGQFKIIGQIAVMLLQFAISESLTKTNDGFWRALASFV